MDLPEDKCCQRCLKKGKKVEAKFQATKMDMAYALPERLCEPCAKDAFKESDVELLKR